MFFRCCNKFPLQILRHKVNIVFFPEKNTKKKFSIEACNINLTLNGKTLTVLTI